jgi:hypothetical protein
MISITCKLHVSYLNRKSHATQNELKPNTFFLRYFSSPLLLPATTTTRSQPLPTPFSLSFHRKTSLLPHRHHPSLPFSLSLSLQRDVQVSPPRPHSQVILAILAVAVVHIQNLEVYYTLLLYQFNRIWANLC